MSRGLNWERAKRDAQQAAARVQEPGRTVYVRRSERTDPFLLRCCRYATSCEACGDAIIKGERCWMLRGPAGWRFRHEACHEP